MAVIWMKDGLITNSYNRGCTWALTDHSLDHMLRYVGLEAQDGDIMYVR